MLFRSRNNIEVQNDQKLEYHVETRGIYYCARMISAQKNRTFRHSEYQKIRKVYSIWICPYAKCGKNTVTAYNINAKKVYGEAEIPKDAYDKLEMVVITLNAEGLQSENDLIKYLSLLLNHEMSLEDRERTLEKEYHLQMTEEIKKEVGNVCNYSSALVQQGENRLARLMSRLFSLGRIKDAEKASTDEAFRAKLIAEMEEDDLKANPC